MTTKIAVGTGNPGKIASVRRALASYPTLSSLEISPQAVESNVSDQPCTLEETTRGALNRAKAALAAADGASLGIGMESGLFDHGDKTFDICACVIWDGENDHVGYSCAWELPRDVRNKFKNEGKNLTDGFNEVGLCDDPKIGDKGGVLAVVTGGRVTRPDYTVQSIQMALVALDNQQYTCSAAVPDGVNLPPPAAPVLSKELLTGAVVGAGLAVAMLTLFKRIKW